MPSRRIRRRTRSSTGAVTATVTSHSPASPPSNRAMASMAASAGFSPRRRSTSRFTAAWVILFKSSRAFLSENTKFPSFFRCKTPSSTVPGKRSSMAARRDASRVSSSWLMASQSRTTAPRSFRTFSRVVFPQPVPPVMPRIMLPPPRPQCGMPQPFSAGSARRRLRRPPPGTGHRPDGYRGRPVPAGRQTGRRTGC